MKTITITALLFLLTVPLLPQTKMNSTDIDKKVKTFLERKEGSWHEANIPESDGKLLYDIIIKNNYTRVLEIGTSTGYSAIWIAWALSKTGGKLITIEIDEERYKAAIVNFKEAGLSDYIDARLADAHKLVHQLKGPLDFAFMDADISTDYFDATAPRLVKGGVYVSHGVRNQNSEYANYLKGLKEFETNFNTGGGFCISKKK